MFTLSFYTLYKMYMIRILKKGIITDNVNGGHGDRGDPRCSRCCGFKIFVYLDVEDTEGLDDPKGQSED